MFYDPIYMKYPGRVTPQRRESDYQLPGTRGMGSGCSMVWVSFGGEVLRMAWN